MDFSFQSLFVALGHSDAGPNLTGGQADAMTGTLANELGDASPVVCNPLPDAERVDMEIEAVLAHINAGMDSSMGRQSSPQDVERTTHDTLLYR